MVLVEQVISNLDVNVEDITEVRVFHLKHADPQQTADQLASLFPNTSTSSSQGGGRGQIRFGGGPGGGFFGPFGMGGGAAGNQSDRQQKQSQVTAVPDTRTGSVIVSAARNLMEEIGRMIEQLDSDPAGQQGVFVYKMENTDPQAVATLLQTLIPQAGGNYGNTRMNSSQQNNPLSYRANQRTQGGSTGFGNSGFGTGSGMGGGRSSMGGGMGGGRIGP
jgi:type II secretory pathway component GspD/PulD (secretin)